MRGNISSPLFIVIVVALITCIPSFLFLQQVKEMQQFLEASNAQQASHIRKLQEDLAAFTSSNTKTNTQTQGYEDIKNDLATLRTNLDALPKSLDTKLGTLQTSLGTLQTNLATIQTNFQNSSSNSLQSVEPLLLALDQSNVSKCIGAKGKQCWREAKRRAWLAGIARLEREITPEQLKRFEHPAFYNPFDVITPTHECDLNYLTRPGKSADGGKWVCGPLDFSSDKSCVIFSLGSNGQFDFEQAMKEFSKGVCKIYTFDCTGNWTDSSTTSYPWCIAGTDYTDDKGRIYKRVSTIVQDLKISHISYLKMDIEGYEWQVLPDILSASNKVALPQQISFELHDHSIELPWSPVADMGSPPNWLWPFIKLAKIIDNSGYRFAAQEKNVLCDTCYEYVLVREDVA